MSSASTIESVLVENRVFPPDERAQQGARVAGMAAYEALCQEAETDFEGFWAKRARANLVWDKPFTRVLDESNAPFFKWFEDGELNASYNCLERNLQNGNAGKVAIIFEQDDGTAVTFTYQQVYDETC